MKKLIYITSCLVFLSCLAQNRNIIKKIDVTNFERGTTYTNDSTKIHKFSISEGYVFRITPKNSLYQDYYEYYNSGDIKIYKQSIANGTGTLGKIYKYDDKGKIIQVIDEDKDFQFTFDDVQKYAKEQEIDLLKTSIGKNSENGWTLNYKGYYKGEKGYYREEEGSYIIRLDKTTGEEILVTRKSARLIIRNPVSAGFIYDTVYYKGKYYPPVMYIEETE